MRIQLILEQFVDAQGNFSIEVLKAAIQNKYGIQLPHLTAKDLQPGNGMLDITDYQGFLYHKSDHWFAIRKIGGRFWNLNSTVERPEVISHFTLATEISRSRNEGYTVFCVPDGLPPVGYKPSNPTPTSYGRWHRMSDLLRGKSTDESSLKDPWENVGSGMRLDGKKSGASSLASSIASNGIIEGLSEEEQLQLALQFSLEPEAQVYNNPTTSANSIVPVPTEPVEGTTGVIKIRFRLPNNKVVVRRFLENDTVAIVYLYVVEQCQSSD